MQAVATFCGKHLVNYRNLRCFATTIAKELVAPSIFGGFRQADALRSNFHEVELEPQDVAVVVESIGGTVAKILDLIPREVLEDKPRENTDE